MEKPASEVLHELLEKIRQRPQIYIGEKSLVKLRHFLNGAACALYSEDDADSGDFLKGFQEWVRMKYDITSIQHWSSIIGVLSLASFHFQIRKLLICFSRNWTSSIVWICMNEAMKPFCAKMRHG